MPFLEADGFAQALRGVLDIAVVRRFRSHQFGKRRGDNIELLLRCLFRAATGVLEQHHQQKREAARDSMNGRLPFLEVCPRGQADQPDRDDAGTYEEERSLADPEVGPLDEPVKRRSPRLRVSAASGRTTTGPYLL